MPTVCVTPAVSALLLGFDLLKTKRLFGFDIRKTKLYDVGLCQPTIPQCVGILCQLASILAHTLLSL
jgi:hypothetical protein